MFGQNVFRPKLDLLNSVILINIKSYIESAKDLILTVIAIDLANIFFALGGVVTFLGLKKVLVNKIYIYSRQRKNQ